MSMWPDEIVTSGPGEMITTHTPRWWRPPRVAQVGFSTKIIRRARVKAFEDDIHLTVGLRIRTERCAAGVRQIDLAKTIGMSQASLSRIETGHRPVKVAELVRIAIQLRRPLEVFTIPWAPGPRQPWEHKRVRPTIPYWLVTLAQNNGLPLSHPMYD